MPGGPPSNWRVAIAFSLYDAAERAQRLRVPLATLDRELAAAAKAEGIAVLGTD